MDSKPIEELTSAPPQASQAAAATPEQTKQPICMIVIGMAGSGKTSFIQRLNSHMHMNKQRPYVVNLDPACHEVPYPCNIDIRDTVNYKEVMKQYSLGPNGAIMTSLNLFTTKFEQVMNLIDKRANEIDYVLFDTPGQIEVFTWSASGSIITESLASTFPTIIVYVIDTPRSVNPVTFMSNMLYACSILYKSKLPFIIVMNKNDIIHHSFAGEWMQNFEAFQNALDSETTYTSNLTRSMSLVLDEFYQNINYVGLSSMTGLGFDDFMKMLQISAEDYEKNYKPEYERLKQKHLKKNAELEKEKLESIKSKLNDYGSVIGGAKKSLLDDPEDAKSRRVKHPGDSGIDLAAFRQLNTNEDDDDDDESYQTRDDHDEAQEKLETESFKRFLSAQKK